VDDDWWRQGVVYQIYPRSFADADGDGVGDLAGITARLDHLNDGTPGSLGVDAVWLSPIYPSPGHDLGYDVADHTAIDPRFGSMADFDRLVAEAHARGIGVILDLVMNHTSHECPWFRSSRTARTGPHAAWYLWRDPKGVDRRGRPRPPNNWVSWFGGPAWTWEPARGQFYMHTFLPEQPDLNWRHPAVRAAMLDIVRFWLSRGVDGFRLDVFNAFFKHPDLPDDPPRAVARWRPAGWRAWDRLEHVYDKDQPEMAGLLAEFRAILDASPGRMSVGELFTGDPMRAASYAAPRHLIFDVRLTEQPWSADRLAQAIEDAEQANGPSGWPAVVMGNHDQPRQATRLSRGRSRDREAIARAAAVLLLTLRGTPFSTTARRSASATCACRDGRCRILRPVGTGPCPSGSIATGAAARCPGPPARTVASRAAGRGRAWRRTTRLATSPPRMPTRPRSSRSIVGSSGCDASYPP
jgi:alpha-glucosidase